MREAIMDKGITLVALVITVIILLILAGVTISLITGGDLLFGKVREASEKYNEAARNEAEIINAIELGEWEKSSTDEPLTNGEFNKNTGINVPDTSKLTKSTTKYVTWTGEGIYQEVLSETVPTDWYDYKNSKWANIKTTSTDGSLEAYWVWIPRFAYKLPENGRNAKTIEVAFVEGTGKTVVLENGTKEQGYYSTDSEITTDGTGVYINKRTDAHTKWIIHPAFTFGDKQLSGIWVAKYEASSSNSAATYGGGNNSTLKVQVKPNVKSWEYLNTNNTFIVCRAMQDNGGALGTVTGTGNVDTHMIKNMEWGAVSILSQSKYGFYVSGVNQQVWNNPNNSGITGSAGTTKDQTSTVNASCYTYNTTNGVKASTTGNVYGVYDMAGGTWEQVAGVLSGYEESIIGNGIDKKYYDLYKNTSNNNSNYDGGKIGDLTRELAPASNNVSWNADYAFFVADSISTLFYRGGNFENGTSSGIFAFLCNDGSGVGGFRPVLVII